MITLERQSILSAEIAAVDTRNGVSDSLSRVSKEFGFRYFFLSRVAAKTDTQLARLVLQTNVPDDYIREFDRRKLLQKCPVSSRIADYALPYSWVLDDFATGGEWPAALVDMHLENDLTAGVAMALHSIDGSSFRMCMLGNRPRLKQAELNEIGMLILQIFSVFDRLRRSQRTGGCLPLTSRELEVVRWTSQGKTSSEIGKILSLSDHTINAYLTNAIKKLDCVNRTQLVATALRMKLIA